MPLSEEMLIADITGNDFKASNNITGRLATTRRGRRIACRFIFSETRPYFHFIYISASSKLYWYIEWAILLLATFHDDGSHVRISILEFGLR